MHGISTMPRVLSAGLIVTVWHASLSLFSGSLERLGCNIGQVDCQQWPSLYCQCTQFTNRGKPAYWVIYASGLGGGRSFICQYRRGVVVCCREGPHFCLVYLALAYFSRSDHAKLLKYFRICRCWCVGGGRER